MKNEKYDPARQEGGRLGPFSMDDQPYIFVNAMQNLMFFCGLQY
jgi:hypothetical protein